MGGLVVDNVHGVRQRPLVAGERVGVELKHEDGALASGQVLHLAGGVLDDLRRADITV
jgi:hypothetical protein